MDQAVIDLMAEELHSLSYQIILARQESLKLAGSNDSLKSQNDLNKNEIDGLIKEIRQIRSSENELFEQVIN